MELNGYYRLHKKNKKENEVQENEFMFREPKRLWKIPTWSIESFGQQ